LVETLLAEIKELGNQFGVRRPGAALVRMKDQGGRMKFPMNQTRKTFIFIKLLDFNKTLA